MRDSVRPHSAVGDGWAYGLLWWITEAHAPGDAMAVHVPIYYASGWGGKPKAENLRPVRSGFQPLGRRIIVGSSRKQAPPTVPGWVAPVIEFISNALPRNDRRFLRACGVAFATLPEDTAEKIKQHAEIREEQIVEWLDLAHSAPRITRNRGDTLKSLRFWSGHILTGIFETHWRLADGWLSSTET